MRESPGSDDDNAGPGGDAAWMSDFTVSAAEFRALYQRLRRASEQGPADRLGALNNITSAEVVAAASDVWRGRRLL